LNKGPQNSLTRPISSQFNEQINLGNNDQNRILRFNSVRQTNIEDTDPPAYNSIFFWYSYKLTYFLK